MIAHLHASLNFAIYGLMNRNLCPGSAAHMLGSCCSGVTLSGSVVSVSCDAQRTATPDGSREACNRRVYASRKLVVVEYHALRDIDGCS